MYYTAHMSSSAAPDHPSPRPRWDWLNPHSTRAGAWTSDSLLEHVRFENRRLEAIDGIQRNFFYPWPAVAQHNAYYLTYVRTEEVRLGPDHPLFRTQYLLDTLSSAGRLFSETQLSQME